MPNRRQLDWVAIRADYEAGMSTIAAIAAGHDLHESSIRRRAKREGWARGAASTAAVAAGSELPAALAAAPSAPAGESAAGTGPLKKATRKKITRAALIARVYRALATNLELMENRMSKERSSTSADSERDMRAIGSVVQTVERAKEVETDTASAGTAGPLPRGGKPRTAAEANELRNKLAERIHKLRERKQP
jgi:hypothetical protein